MKGNPAGWFALGCGVVAIGLVLSGLVLIQQTYVFVTGEAHERIALSLREFMLSPLLVLLVFFLLWLERFVGRIFEYRGRGSARQFHWHRRPVLVRLRQWLGVFLAWVTTGTATLLLFAESGREPALLLGCLVLFGGAMWVIERPTPAEQSLA